MKKSLIYLLLFACSTTYAQQSNESNKEELNRILMALGEEPMSVPKKESNALDAKATVVDTNKKENVASLPKNKKEKDSSTATKLNNIVADLEQPKKILKIDNPDPTIIAVKAFGSLKLIIILFQLSLIESLPKRISIISLTGIDTEPKLIFTKNNIKTKTIRIIKWFV